MEMRISSVTIAPQASATTKAPPATENGSPMSKEDIQNLRDQVRQTIRAQVAGVTGQDGVPAPAASPNAPRTITIRGPDGSQTVVAVPQGFNARDMVPPQAVDISIAFFVTVAIIIIGLPIARAIARRMDRRSGTTEIPRELTSQLTQLTQAVDAIALEVERISEGQRFTTRLLSEQRDAARETLPAPTNR
jgi:hypothetical protein